MRGDLDRRARRGRRHAARLALLVTALLGSLIASELLVRALLPALDPACQLRLVAHGPLVLGPAGTRARQVKNTGDYDVQVHFGPRGFRDPRDVAHARPEDVLVVGDSFAFGWGVEQAERFSDRLERSTGARVWNLAIPGQDLDGYARLLGHAERLGARARRLIVALSVETDLHDYARAAHARPAHHAAAEPWLARAKPWLAQRSALYALVTTTVHRFAPLEALAVRLGLVVPNLARVGPGAQSESVLRSVADRVASLARGYEATVLLVPARGLWLEHTRSAESRLHAALVAALRARALEVVDPRPAFEATGTPLAHHFERDGHWNARGHRVAAELLARALSARRSSHHATARAANAMK